MRFGLASLGVFVAAISLFGLVTPATSQTYPFCHAGDASYSSQCDYSTLEQCQITAFGGQGYCFKNPAYAADARSGDHLAASTRRTSPARRQ
jgi:hypothetical protein